MVLLRSRKHLVLFLSLLAATVTPCLAATSGDKEKQAVLDQKIKLNALIFSKDATQLVEDVGFPESDRLKIYVTHSEGLYFELEKVTIIIDGLDRDVHVLDEVQRKALMRGASKRIYLGVLVEGIHELVAVFEGHDRQGNVIKKAQSWLFDKRIGENIIELSVLDNKNTLRPQFEFSVVKGGR